MEAAFTLTAAQTPSLLLEAMRRPVRRRRRQCGGERL